LKVLGAIKEEADKANYAKDILRAVVEAAQEKYQAKLFDAAAKEAIKKFPNIDELIAELAKIYAAKATSEQLVDAVIAAAKIEDPLMKSVRDGLAAVADKKGYADTLLATISSAANEKKQELSVQAARLAAATTGLAAAATHGAGLGGGTHPAGQHLTAGGRTATTTLTTSMRSQTISDADWQKIIQKIKTQVEAKHGSVRAEPSGSKITVSPVASQPLKGQYEVTRNNVDRSIAITSNAAPPDVASMVESFKTAASVNGQDACDLSSAADPTTALNIIGMLMSKPEPIIIPTVKDPQLLSEMRAVAKKAADTGNQLFASVIAHYDSKHAAPEERAGRKVRGPGDHE